MSHYCAWCGDARDGGQDHTECVAPLRRIAAALADEVVEAEFQVIAAHARLDWTRGTKTG